MNFLAKIWLIGNLDDLGDRGDCRLVAGSLRTTDLPADFWSRSAGEQVWPNKATGVDRTKPSA
jgi:hypothetical protein